MTEHEFADLIDARFPYADDERSKQLMAIAAGISFNASLCVLYEIILPPHPIEIEAAKFHDLLSVWRASVDDPMADSFAEYAVQIHAGGVGGASDDFARKLLERLDRRTELLAGLSIIAMGGGTEIELICEQVRAEWSTKPH